MKTTTTTTTTRNAYEAIVHEYAVECADRADREESEAVYTSAVEKITRDDDLFADYCREAEMTEKEITAALALK